MTLPTTSQLSAVNMGPFDRERVESPFSISEYIIWMVTYTNCVRLLTNVGLWEYKVAKIAIEPIKTFLNVIFSL